jgi:hypothetical protein
MDPPSTSVACPCCAHPCEVVDSTCNVYPSLWHLTWLEYEPTKVRCPACGWEFTVSSNGEVEDDGGLDPDGPFEIDSEGELCGETLLPAACPACGRRFEVGEPGVTTCPGCRRRFEVWEELPDPGNSNGRGDEDDSPEWADPCPYCQYGGDIDGPEFTPLDEGFVACDACGGVFHAPALNQEITELCRTRSRRSGS